MLISVLGGFLYQWDTGRKVCVTDIGNTVVSEIHIETKSLNGSLVLTTEVVDSRVIADIPNIVLQTAEPITVYAMVTNKNGRQTKYGQSFTVVSRSKPDDYVYAEEEVLTYRTLENRINEIEKHGVSQDNIAKAIEKYFNDNPVEGGVDEAQLTEAVQTALREAKESGMFNGEPGQDGSDGRDGEDGFSPTISVMQLEDGYEISVSNKTETKTYMLKHGKDGTDGKDGANYILTSVDKQDIASLVHVPDKIHVGSDTPTNSEATVWINPDENDYTIPLTSQDVSNALGYNPAKQEDVTSLFEEMAELKGEIEGEVITKNGTVVEIECASKAKLTVNANTSETVNLYHFGENMLPAYGGADTTSSGCTITKNADGKVTISGTPTATVYFNVVTTAAPIYLPAGDYTLVPFGFPDVASHIVFTLESLDGTVKKNVTINGGVNSFTLEQGNTFRCNYTVRNTYTGEPITLGVMLVNKKVLSCDYEKPTFEKINTAFPATLTAYKGTNILYTDSGDVLTVRTVSGDKKNTFDPAAYGLPVLRLWGDTSTMTKDDAVDLEYEYGDLTGIASVKWQGSSSLTYPKKNYTVKFDQEFEAVEGWGAQKKYCMKANYIDFSHSRNVVAAKLWGQIVASRNPANDALAACPNYGAVDGFPIIIAINDEFAGVYTFNIPKDGWMLNMGSGANEAILCADLNSAANNFKAEAVVGGNQTDFELEYVSDENNTAWVQPSLNNLINACIASDGADLDTTIAAMLDWDSAIDYWIFCALIDHRDGVGKNYLLHTWDGTKWYFDAYDMDSIFGLKYNGKEFFAANTGTTVAFLRGRHRVAELICKYKLDTFKARYAALRAGALTEENVSTLFRNFAGQISRPLLDEDNRLWPMIPLTNTNNVQQAIDWYRLRVKKIDAEVEAMK
jgi:hypothetical protein